MLDDLPDEILEQMLTSMQCVQVLGHHMSKHTTELYSKAQSLAQWDEKVLPSVDDELDLRRGKARSRLEQNVEQYLSR